ncbi:MAG: hypothetical protein ACK5OI_14215 [Curvibacter sp.]
MNHSQGNVLGATHLHRLFDEIFRLPISHDAYQQRAGARSAGPEPGFPRFGAQF